jgi:hypothetical protein
MTRKPSKRTTSQRASADPEQYARFLEAAKRAEASDDPKALDKALKGVARPKQHPPKSERPKKP